MASSLPSEFNKFCRLTKQLRQIHRDTQKCFRDINTVGNFELGQNFYAELSPAEEEQIESVIKKYPCLLVLGQTCYAKAFIVNQIFNKNILPVIDYDDESPNDNTPSVKWRMVRFKYGDKNNIGLGIPGTSFELLDSLVAYKQPWHTIPEEDLEVGQNTEEEGSAKDVALLDVRLCHSLLKDGGQVIVSPWNYSTLEKVYQKCSINVVPVVIYAISREQFTEKEMEDLERLKTDVPDIAIFFVKVPAKDLVRQVENNRNAPPMSAIQNALERHRVSDDKSSLKRRPRDALSSSPHKIRKSRVTARTFSACMTLFNQLLDLGYLSPLPNDVLSEQSDSEGESDYVRNYTTESELIYDFENFSQLALFVRRTLQNYLVRTTSLLNVIHTRCLQMFIMSAFDMARDMIITPKRIEFAKARETELYNSLMELALKKQDEIKKLIATTLNDMRQDLLDKATEYDFIGVNIPESGEIMSPRDLKTCTGQIQELILSALNSAIAGKLIGSVDILKDSYTGVLARCLESLEKSDSYDKDSSDSGYSRTSLAFKEILNSAYQVEITVRAGSSIIRIFVEKMRQLMHTMPWNSPPIINEEWKRSVAADMLDSLSESRLAKSICAQIKDRLKHSHETFAAALKQLEIRHSGRLERTEEQRLKVRKVHAPKVARLALESTSLRDYILYGMPNMGREVGRGQYGVVYSCDTWAGYSPVAIKSVVPPDDKHWNDLALEFYYTKNVPEHERIVALRGSVIDYTYGGGSSPAVLLVMDRLQRDLYSAIKTGLDWLGRLQVAIDVVEGIRFLHSQGLVHRDIKLKNVLLDKKNRGRITDLGFCKPEAMMSGSIVGTPIHMAPELFSGCYDNSVDTYAFGILLWYVCAGHVKLPYTFEQCTSKDMLWTSVKRGVRPERLSQFTEESWLLMKACWHGEPAKRPLLGVVEPQLRSIHEQEKIKEAAAPPESKSSRRRKEKKERERDKDRETTNM